MEQDALLAVDIGDRALAAGGRGEAGVVGEHAGLGVELADVDDVRADRALEHGIGWFAAIGPGWRSCRSLRSAPPSDRRCGPGFRPSRAAPARRKFPAQVVRPVSAARSGWASLPSLTPGSRRPRAPQHRSRHGPFARARRSAAWARAEQAARRRSARRGRGFVHRRAGGCANRKRAPSASWLRSCARAFSSGIARSSSALLAASGRAWARPGRPAARRRPRGCNGR